MTLQADGEVGDIESLVASLSSPLYRPLHLDGASLVLRSQYQPQPGGMMLVWRAFTCGQSVRHGIVELPEGGVLLLTGHGASFHGTTFKGAASFDSSYAMPGRPQPSLRSFESDVPFLLRAFLPAMSPPASPRFNMTAHSSDLRPRSCHAFEK